ncbi:hypothetical protein [Natronomonas marina]|jgi:hypothetical protein|uniref:hypothetical protein n=1 Tax=Natronomonas marina TaxID=2961939 RepID=UPI0020C9B46B|nr:hypothetical protein [Natronomonas marina]
MSLDIGEAFGEGLSRLSTRAGLSLAVVFALVALVSAVLSQTLQIEALEAMLETFRAASPEQLDLTQAEYDRQIEVLETQLQTVRETSPLALGVPLSVAAGGLLVVAFLAEAVSIVAVRAFAADDPEAVALGDATGGLGLATLNGFVGGIVVWGLIAVGSVFLLVPGLFFAVVFYFLRQRIALEDENFVDALAASWRLTKGNRLNVFALGLLVVVVSQIDLMASLVLAPVSAVAATVVSAAIGGVLAAFGAAAVTRGYLQLTEREPPDEAERTAGDPYDGALGPEDIPE